MTEHSEEEENNGIEHVADLVWRRPIAPRHDADGAQHDEGKEKKKERNLEQRKTTSSKTLRLGI
jgi:hypothetical protein